MGGSRGIREEGGVDVGRLLLRTGLLGCWLEQCWGELQ